MNRVPHSSSQLFNTGKKKPKPQSAPRSDSKPSHQIRVEKTIKQNQNPMTPMDIQKSFQPSQVRIDRSIKKSVSFSKNGVEIEIIPQKSVSDPEIAAMIPLSPSQEFPIKSIYTVEDMLFMKPTTYTKKLITPGFIMLLHLKSKNLNQNGPDQYPKRNKANRKPSQNQSQPKLLTRSGDRFISSADTKAVGLYDEKSPDIIRTEAQRILNRLNSRNLSRCIKEVQMLSIKQDELIMLLLQRATMDTEFPERNVQLTNFITFSIDYANSSPKFGSQLVAMSYEAADKLIGEVNNIPIASFQCMAVWLSALFNANLGEEHELYAFLNKVMRNEPKERAIDVIRCGMCICGKKAGPNFEIFYDFLKKHPSQYGFKRYLVEELFTLKDNHWNRNVPDPNQQTVTLRIEHGRRNEEQKEDSRDVDLASEVECDYSRWLNEEEFEFTKFQVDVTIRLTLRQLRHHFKDANSFVQYSASILSNCSKDNGKIADLIRDHFSVYSENVRVEENPGMWTIYFMLLAAYFAETIVRFELIQELIFRALETEHPPRMKAVVFRMAEITGIPIDSLLLFKESIPEPIKSDPEFNQGLVALAEFQISESDDEFVIGQKSMIHAGVLVRDTVSAAMQEDVPDPTVIISEKKTLFKQLFELYGRNLISVAKHVIDMYQVALDKKSELTEFIEHSIFEAE